jgi:hypothetical protein
MKKTLIITALAAIMAVTSAQAAFYNLNPPDPDATISGSNASDADVLAAIQANSAYSTYTAAQLGSVLYKSDVTTPPTDNGTDDKEFASSYTTLWDPANGSGSLTITYDGAPLPYVSAATWLIIKDGNPGGSWLWDISDWNGTDTITFGNDPELLGIYDISHVAIYGTAVPEPATVVAGALLLLPFGASLIRIVRKNRGA